MTMSFDDDDKERYNRWQGLRIAQLGTCLSLFLTFSVATLGFSINLLNQAVWATSPCGAKLSLLWSLVFGVLSCVLGSSAYLTRLCDFRLTARVVRHSADPNVNQWRTAYKRLGQWTWRLFIGQLIFFAVQVGCLLGTVRSVYNLHLF